MNPMLRTSSFVFILALLALMPSSDAEETSSEDALVVAVSSSFFMQGNVLGQGGAPSGSFVYEGLVTKNRESGYDGWLAESWESNEDATAWTFHLVEAQWHDGQPFISEDVEFTYNYITDNKMWLASVLSMVDYVDCPDERTAVFHMKSPSPAFLDDISHCPGICIIPKHIWEDIDDPDHYVDEEFVGTGPFKFVSVVPDQYVKLVANGDYYGGRPAIGEVILKIIPNKDAQILAMKSGEVDVVSEISPAVAQSIEGSNGIETFVAPETRGYELGFNLNNYPTDSPEFRKAMAHAIDREKICDIVFGGYATPTETTFLMPSVAYDFVNPDVPGDDYEYDLEKAGEMLDAAGFTDSDGDGWRDGSDGEDVVMIIPITGMGADDSKIAEVLREDWKELGIKVEMKQVESSQKQSEYHNSNFFIVGMPYLMHDDADDLTHFEVDSHFGNPNWYDYDEPDYNALAEELRNTADQDERKEIGYQMQEILAEDVPTVPICSTDVIFAYRADRFAGWEDVAPLYWSVDTKMILNVRRA